MKKLLKGFMPVLFMIVLWSCSNQENNIQTEIKIPVSVETIKPKSISRDRKSVV